MKKKPSSQDHVTCSLKVEGMDCPSCEKTVRNAVESYQGFHSLETNYFEKKLTITAPGDFDFQTVINRIEKLGYPTARFISRPQQEKENNNLASIRLLEILRISVSALLTLTATILMFYGVSEIFLIPMFVSAIILSGYPIFRKGFQAILSLSLDMNSLMTIAVVGAMFIGEWFEGATVIFLAAVANYLESWSMERSRKAVKKLMDLAPPAGIVIDGDEQIKKMVEDIVVGEIILIKPGAKVPLDSLVIEGESWFNQAPVTGESAPVSKREGDQLFAGSINSSGIVKARVVSLAQDSTIARIIHMVQDAQVNKAPTERFINKFASIYTPVAVGIALLIATLPPLFDGQWHSWLYRALVLLVIACPCALVISTPVGIISGLSAAARAGVLIKGGSYLEKAAAIDHVVFDKTGTLTNGLLQVRKVISCSNEFPEDRILQLMASLEKGSEHHIASALVAAAVEKNIPFTDVSDNQIFPGKGVKGTIDKQEYYAGNRRIFPETARKKFTSSELGEFEGMTLVYLGRDNQIIGAITLEDQLRPEAARAITELHNRGIETSMLSGDNQTAAEAAALRAGIENSFGSLLPDEKLEKIKLMKNQGKCLVMVGDGINDAPSLAAADIGIAMGKGGTDVALETADIALMSDNLNLIPYLVDHSQRAMAIIKQNIVFSITTKIIFVILSISGLSSLWMAVMADTGLSLLVTSNSLRLLGKNKTIH